jgi:hypothetical protein
MNSTDKHKQSSSMTTAAIGIGLLLLAAAFAISYGSSQQVAVAQQQQQTQNSNATTVSNTTRTDTFTANGIITGTIQSQGGGQQTAVATSNTTQSGNQTSNMTQTSGASTSSAPFLVGGDWGLKVENGNVTNFHANFTMVRTDGSEHHSHDITNFKVGNNTQFQLDPKGKTTINGTADYLVNGTSKWPGQDTTITIEKATILTIQPQEQEVKQHFQGQPIYGIALTITGENGTKITESVPAGGNQTQPGGAGSILDQLKKPFEGLLGGGKK